MQDSTTVTTTLKGPSIIVVDATIDGHVNVKIEAVNFPTSISTDVPVENIDGLVEALLAKKAQALTIRAAQS